MCGEESPVMKNMLGLFPFEMGRCPAVPSAQNWQTPVGPRSSHLLSGDVWPEVVFMEELQPRVHTAAMETRPSHSTVPENTGTGLVAFVQMEVESWSGLMGS